MRTKQAPHRVQADDKVIIQNVCEDEVLQCVGSFLHEAKSSTKCLYVYIVLYLCLTGCLQVEVVGDTMHGRDPYIQFEYECRGGVRELALFIRSELQRRRERCLFGFTYKIK